MLFSRLLMAPNRAYQPNRSKIQDIVGHTKAQPNIIKTFCGMFWLSLLPDWQVRHSELLALAEFRQKPLKSECHFFGLIKLVNARNANFVCTLDESSSLLENAEILSLGNFRTLVRLQEDI